MKETIVLAWVENTGLRDTGKVEQVDRNWRPVFEVCSEAKACVFSSDLKDLDRAKEYVKHNEIAEGIGYYVFVLPDTEDVLKVAREKVLERIQAGKAE